MTASHGTRLRKSTRNGRNLEDGSRHDDGGEVGSRDLRASTGEQEYSFDKQDEEEVDGEQDEETDSRDTGDDEDDDGEEDDDEEDDDEEDDEEEEEEDGVAEEEEDESPFKFLEGLDANWLTGRSVAAEPRSAPRNDPAGSSSRSPAASADDTEFYGAMIQMLTHVLGSSDSITWTNQATPGSQLAPSPFGHPYSSPAPTPNHATPSLTATSRTVIGGNGASTSSSRNRGNKSELSALQPMIQALIARLGKDHQLPRRPVGEQDLTALLQTLMQQQQRQQDQQATKGSTPRSSASLSGPTYEFAKQGSTSQIPTSLPSQQYTGAEASFDLSTGNKQVPLHFADLDFEDEDEDDPDFNPDLNPNLPLPTAWSMAVRDVVASEESRAAAAAAAAAASHSGTPSGAQTPADMLRPGTVGAGNPQQNGRSDVLLPLGDAEGRRSSFEQPSARSSRYNSFSETPVSAPSTSAAPARSVEHDTRRSATRNATPPSLALAGVQANEASNTSGMLFSPSGRPIRASRKRQGSPTTAPQARPMRSDVQATSVTPQRDENDGEQSAPRKRGRKPVLEPGEAQRRRAQRNVEYQRMRRQVKKAEESEQSEAVLELKAEVKMLRAEMERLRDENAMLRAQRELDRLQRSSYS